MDYDPPKSQKTAQHHPKLKHLKPSSDYPIRKSSLQKSSRIIQQYNQPLPQKQLSPSLDDIHQLKNQNIKLKKIVKQTQAKRIQITKQCSELTSKYQKLSEQNTHLHLKIKSTKQLQQSDKFRYQQQKFLTKQLSSQIQHLQHQNQSLSNKLKYHEDILQKKYQNLQQKIYKRIQQALKRIKKAIHYLNSFSIKEIQKTKDIQLDNLKKTIQILKGKYSDSSNNNFQQEIQQLMNPILHIQEDLHQKIKQITALKNQNIKLTSEIKKHKKIQQQLLPQYKQTIQKFKKNLQLLRVQLSQNQFDKFQIKKKYQDKIKTLQHQYDQLFKAHRKIKLQNKIFQKKIQDIQDDVQQQKQRLIGQNQLLKKLYHNQNQNNQQQLINNHINQLPTQNQFLHDLEKQNKIEALSYKTTTNNFRKNIDQPIIKSHHNLNQQDQQFSIKQYTKKPNLKKNYSASQLLKFSRQKQYQQLHQPQPQPKKQLHKLKLSDQDPPPQTHQNHHQPLPLTRQKPKKNYDHLRHAQQSQQKHKTQPLKQKQPIQIFDYHHHQQTQPDQPQPSDSQSQYRQQYHEENSQSIMSVSQQGLKNQIFKIDQQIMQIQKTLDKQLNMFK